MKKIFAFIVASIPALALAQTTPITDANSLTQKLVDIGNTAIYLLISLAVIFIIYNVVMYLVKGNNPEEKGVAGKNVLWGIVGLAVILSIWGLVNILTGTFRTTPANTPIPQISNGNVPIIR